MGDELHRLVTWLMAGSVFGLIFSLWFIGMLLSYLRRAINRQRLEQRLSPGEGRKSEGTRVLRLWHEGRVTTTMVPGRRLSTHVSARINETCEALGWDLPPVTIIFAFLGLISLAFAIALGLTGRILVALAACTAVIVISWSYVQRRTKQRTELFERQFADALGLATRSLRAGHPLLGAFRLIVEEMDPPVSTVFAEITQQQALGVSLEEAIRTTAAKSASPDLKLFAASIVIQLRGGGNLADMMDRLADVIRDRIRLNRRVRILTSQTQLSKRVLIGVPFVIFIALYVLNPGYLVPLYSTHLGKVLLVVAGVCLIVGRWIMNRIAVLRY